MREVVTVHIQEMLTTALELAGSAEHGPHDPALCLGRAANLARHAAAELEDELYRHTFGEDLDYRLTRSIGER